MDRAGGYDEYAFIADLYDYVVPYSQRQDVAFFVEAAQAAGGPVLEVGCGTGRVLMPTARAGVDIVGLDASPHMLSPYVGTSCARSPLRSKPERA